MRDDEMLQGHLNLIEFSRNVARWSSRHEVVDRTGMMFFVGESDWPAFHNGAFRTDDGLAADRAVQQTVEFFTVHRLGFTFWTRDLPIDADLGQAVQAAGFAPLTRSPQMICRRRPPIPAVCDVTVQRERTQQGVEAVTRLNADAYVPRGIPADVTRSSFERVDRILEPHVAVFVARRGGEALAGAVAMLSHGIGGLYWIATDESARGQGLGAAVTATAANWCFDNGASSVQLQASAMGRPVYERVGFETLYTYDVWQRTHVDDGVSVTEQ